MKKIVALDVAANFQVHEMFFSRTDSKGIILDGNEVFTRISGYDLSQMIGQPHNLIRHPDMPKTVFHFFWETLKAKLPIAAYVKNLSASGHYYWVLASVFPVEDGYISIRVKPNGLFLKEIEKLYAGLLGAEKKLSVEEAERVMLDQVMTLGFKSYRSFAIEALTSELNGRREQMIRQGLKPHRALEPSLARCQIMYQELLRVLESNDVIGQTAVSIREGYRTIKFVGVNMLAEVEKLGTSAQTIGVVAHTFQTWAVEVSNSASQTSQAVDAMTDLVDESSLIIAGSRFQIEMSEYELSHPEKNENLAMFIGFAVDALASVTLNVGKILSESFRVSRELEKLSETLSALHIIRQNGRIEVARLSIDANEFLTQLDHMKLFIENVTTAATLLSKNLLVLRKHLEAIGHEAEEISHDLAALLKARTNSH